MSSDSSSTWERLRHLPVLIESYSLEPLELRLPSGWVRRTTTVEFFGGGHRGRGEDVTYDGREQQQFQARGAHLSLVGSYDLASFSDRLDELELCPKLVGEPACERYRRWAFESAALDLALRQAGLGLDEALGRQLVAPRFVLSLGLRSMAPLRRRLSLDPAARFKLDATPDWSVQLCAELAATNAVAVLDFKGAYEGTAVDTEPDLALYERVLDAFGPELILEDPHQTPQILALLRERAVRVSWDAPIRSLADLDTIPLAPSWLNVKPSRCGTLAALCELYDGCEERELPLYGGGQFELGVGREQIQLLAGHFHSAGPNDVAPRGYHDLERDEPRPRSPLALVAPAAGFGLS